MRTVIRGIAALALLLSPTALAADRPATPLDRPAPLRLDGPALILDAAFSLQPTGAPTPMDSRIEGKALAAFQSGAETRYFSLGLTRLSRDGFAFERQEPFALIRLQLARDGARQGAQADLSQIRGLVPEPRAKDLAKLAQHVAQAFSSGMIRYVADTARQGEPLVDLSPVAIAWIMAAVPDLRQVQAFGPAVVRGATSLRGRPVIEVAVSDQLWVDSSRGNANLWVSGHSLIDQASGLPLETALRFTGPVVAGGQTIPLDYSLRVTLTPRG